MITTSRLSLTLSFQVVCWKQHTIQPDLDRRGLQRQPPAINISVWPCKHVAAMTCRLLTHSMQTSTCEQLVGRSVNESWMCFQEWLWCETWCGNATKKAAKTIDLCNNPLTKEPKLDSARRIVAEWPGLDEEVATFTAQVWSSSCSELENLNACRLFLAMTWRLPF